MQCPHCCENIKYKERTNSICPKCRKEFAFEPKIHPLLLTDGLFAKVVNKISGHKELYFTPQQLQFAVSKKKIKSRSKGNWIFIPAVATTVIFGLIAGLYIFGIFLIVFWAIVIFLARRYLRRNLQLPQTPPDFDLTVLRRWKSVYGKLPSKLTVSHSLPTHFNYALKGVLICEDTDTAICLAANHTEKNLGLALFSQKQSIDEIRHQITKLMQDSGDLPVFVLHDASVEGCVFFEKTKKKLGARRRVFDIGLRPRDVMKSKLMQFRQQSVPKSEMAEITGLTKEEVKWLEDGFYTPLFTLQPFGLICYVTREVDRKDKFIKASEEQLAQREAKSVGFMTWVGE